jgi:hypothetical protein
VPTEIENYEPPDEGWGIVVGRFMPRPEPKPEPEVEQDDVADDGDEQQSPDD